MDIPKDRKILVIDDEPDTLEILADILSDGYSPTTSTDPKRALEIALCESFDLIITDLKMPIISGDQLIKNIRENSINANTPILLLSGFINFKISEALSCFNYIYYLHKPIRYAPLRKKIEYIFTTKDDVNLIHENFFTPIAKSIINTLTVITKTANRATQPLFNTRTKISGDISATLPITNQRFMGILSISFPKDCFMKTVSKIKKKEITEISDEAKSALDTILSQVYYELNMALPKTESSFTAGISTVIVGDEHNFEHSPNSPGMTIPFSSENGEFIVEINGVSI
jgi:CheY-like chemotaxis protein